MELGNILMGHSRGEHAVTNRRGFGRAFQPLLDALRDDNGYGVHFTNDVFELHPYCWCEKPDCGQCGTGEQANFLYKPTGFRLSWYKYPMRDAYMNVATTRSAFQAMVTHCVQSLTA